jgi:hypothetical protein
MKLKNLFISLLDLYSKALYHPDVELEYDGFSDIVISVPPINFDEYDLYWEVFNPYHIEEPVGVSLFDDILEIFREVKRGLILYQKNELIDVLWNWKFNFEIYWGSHTVDAIHALHSANFM